jgi:hypothetical protein
VRNPTCLKITVSIAFSAKGKKTTMPTVYHDLKDSARSGGAKSGECCAWVFLVMRGDSYVPGALVAGFSLRLTATRHRLLCMVTSDVSPVAKQQLGCVFDEVLPVEYLRARCKPLRGERQKQMYPWISDSFTKWRCLALTQFDRVIFLDADTVVLSNMDHLFDLRAPAATFSSPWARPYTKVTKHRPHERPGRDGLYNPYRNVKHGGAVTGDMVREGLTNRSFVLTGTTVLLRPSARRLLQLERMLRAAERAEGAFGFPGCYSGTDEQALAALYSDDPPEHAGQGPRFAAAAAPTTPSSTARGSSSSSSGRREAAAAAAEVGRAWTMVSQRHNFIPWHPQWLRGEAADGIGDGVPTLFHFFNTKPWNMRRDEWPDLEVFWQLATLLTTHPRLAEPQRKLLAAAFPNAQLSAPAAPVACPYCQSIRRSDAHTHRIFDEHGMLACPQLRRGGSKSLLDATESPKRRDPPVLATNAASQGPIDRAASPETISTAALPAATAADANPSGHSPEVAGATDATAADADPSGYSGYSAPPTKAPACSALDEGTSRDPLPASGAGATAPEAEVSSAALDSNADRTAGPIFSLAVAVCGLKRRSNRSEDENELSGGDAGDADVYAGNVVRKRRTLSSSEYSELPQ